MRLTLSKHTFTTLRRTTLALALCFTAALAASARGGSDKTVYAFGYATCLGDTVAYISEIQQLDSARIAPKTKFLEDRSAYAQQLEQALRRRDGRHYTAAVFYATDRKKIEKQFLRVKKTAQRKKSTTVGIKFETLSAQDFTFTPVTASAE